MAQQNNHEQAKEATPTVAEEHTSSTDSPEATDIPNSNALDPKVSNPQTNPNTAKTTAPKQEKPVSQAKAVKKEKAPGVEDKPFADFIQQDYLPALQKAIAAKGVKDLQLSFVKQKIPVRGMEQLGECWQIVGDFADGVRHFRLYFPDENIQGKKAFSCYEGKQPSVLESFLIDERKVTLELLIWGLLQRLDAQKWLGRN